MERLNTESVQFFCREDQKALRYRNKYRVSYYDIEKS